MMRHHIKVFVQLLLSQFVNYTLAVYSWRMVAKEHVGAAVLVDIVYSSAQFFIIRRIASGDDSVWAWLGMVCGGALGTWLAMTIRWF